MSAIVYLMLTRMKNSLREFFRTPSRLILTIFVVLMLGVSLFSSAMGRGEAIQEGSLRNINELYAIVFAFYFAMSIIICASGLNNGASFFTMADVDMMFTAPFSTRRVLTYGLVRQAGMTVLMAVFLIFQYGWIGSNYDISYGGLLIIIAGYILTVFISQVAAMCIYAFCSGKPKRQTVIKYTLYAFVAAVALWAVSALIGASDPLSALVSRVTSLPFSMLPVAGWLSRFVMGAISGNIVWLLAGLGGAALLLGALILLIIKTDADYYEDVLAATEIAHSAITAKKEGRMTDSTTRNVKVGSQGLNSGEGAGVFFIKHRLEDRRSRQFILDIRTLITVAAGALFAFMMREDGLGIYFGSGFSIYIMVFMSLSDRWARELTMPYIYMVPEDPFKKLLSLMGAQTIKNAVESAIVIAVIGLISQSPVIEILLFILLRFTVAELLMACNVLIERIFGGSTAKWLQMTMYFIFLVVILGPAVAVAIILGALGWLYLGLLAASIWTALAAFIILLCCRGMLEYAELNNK